MRIATAFFMATILVVVVSCGPNNGLDLATVRGTVTYKGEPLQNGTVLFEPDESQGTTGPQATGAILEDGTFVLSSQDQGDGAVVGFHRVGILGLEADPVDSAASGPSPEDDPLGYLAAKDAAAAKDIQARMKGDTSTVTGLDGRSFRVVLPEKLGSASTSGITVEVSSGSNVFHFNVQEDGTVEIE